MGRSSSWRAPIGPAPANRPELIRQTARLPRTIRPCGGAGCAVRGRAMRTFVFAALLWLPALGAMAQSFPPGYLDPAPVLDAAAREIGAAELRCVTFSGTGYDGAVGQTFENAVDIDWPRIDRLENYTRTINWEAGTSKETFDREPGLAPASWKYGLGWQGGTPTQRQRRQT